MPIVCVFIPAFQLAVCAPGRAGLPVLLADRLERGRVVDCSPEAATLGVTLGMTLSQAQACAQEAETVVHDPAATRAMWDQILDALDAASPLVEDAVEGTAYIEMHGIAGSPDRWLDAVGSAVEPFGFSVRLGLGPHPFVARAAAQFGERTIWLKDAAARLAPLPLRILAIEPDDRERLRLLGIQTLGDLAALPHGPFVRRFGPRGARWHAQARGTGARPLVPRARRLRIERTLFGEGSASSEDQVLFALRTLVGRVVDDLIHAGKRCARLQMELECENGETPAIATRVASPTANPATLFEILRARLEGLTLASPVVGLRLRADGLEGGGVPLALFAGDEPDPEVLGLAIARLEAALGERTALRAQVVDGARPETRYAYEPFVFEAASRALPIGTRRPVLPPLPALQYRPLAPRPVDVRLRGGRPALVGTPPQAVLDVAGPWRVDEGWWEHAAGRGIGLRRDDYDVLLEDGALYRVACVSGHDWVICGTYD